MSKFLEEFAPVANRPALVNNEGEWRHAAGQSTVAYDPPQRKGMCAAKNHTCGGRAAKGTRYCAGHLRSMGQLVNSNVKGDEDE